MTRVPRGYIARRRRTKMRSFASNFRGAHLRLNRMITQQVKELLFPLIEIEVGKRGIFVVCGSLGSIVLPVHLVKHLSRESRKLTVMMQRELANHLMTHQNLRDSFRITRRTILLVTYVNAPYSDNRIHTKGYIIDPPSNSYG